MRPGVECSRSWWKPSYLDDLLADLYRKAQIGIGGQKHLGAWSRLGEERYDPFIGGRLTVLICTEGAVEGLSRDIRVQYGAKFQ